MVKFITSGIFRRGMTLAFALCMALAGHIQAREFTLVLDPGHGGKDVGAPGKLTNEKTVVLDVGRRVKKIIEKEHPEVKVLMTRDSDVFVPLKGRAAIANKADADLFISIHCDAVGDKKRAQTVAGSTVYVLGPTKSDANLEVVKRENAVIELEDGYLETYKDIEALTAEQLIMLELNQNLSGSVDFAQMASDELHGTAGRASRGNKSVMPCGFYVLVYTKMPSVLVELDFICNPSVEKFLHSDSGKDKCARALANAFSTYYK
ncbi:MAG: N-acetylmuramoyl-L-alanine amidase, partial [Muribaculaceae bacterium]|nr:N-acetylmuramoyl-L-alanine amidase [Muribaculaceae bacterium]